MNQSKHLSRPASLLLLLIATAAAATLGAISRQASAEDSASAASSSELSTPSAFDHSADIVNLDYYPHARQLLFTPLFSTALNDQNFSGTPSAATGGSTISSSTATLTATYGLFDRVRISLAESALFGTDNTHQNATTGATTFTHASGLSDPTLGATLRYLDDDARTGLSADIGVSVSPSLVTHDVADSLQNGSDGKGYGTLAASAPLFWWLGHNEMELSPAIAREFNGNSVGPTVATSSTRAAAWNGSITWLDRFHFTDKFYLQGGVALNLPYSVQTTSMNNAGTVSTNQYPLYVVPRFDLGYRFSSSILFDAEYEYFNYGTQVLETSSNTQTIESTLAMKFLIQI